MKLNKLLSMTGLATMVASSAFAATQGAEASISTGTMNVSVTVAELVKISELGDIALGTHDPVAGDTATDLFCIYYNNASNVSLTISSANTAGPGYQMANAGNFVPYTVDIQDDARNLGPFVAHTEAATVRYATPESTSNICDLTPVSETTGLRVSVATGALAVPNGDYTDVLTLVIDPSP